MYSSSQNGSGLWWFFFFQAEDGIRDLTVTGVQTCALPILFFKLSSRVVPDDLSGHLVLLGGIGWNDITQRLSQMIHLPVQQIEDPEVKTGEIRSEERRVGKEGRSRWSPYH